MNDFEIVYEGDDWYVRKTKKGLFWNGKHFEWRVVLL